MSSSVRRRAAVIAAALVVAVVMGVLLVPTHPEAGILHLLARATPPGTLAGGSAAWWTVEDLGNITLFVPVGIVASVFVRPLRALAAGIAVSAACETAQLWIPSRHASMHDVLLNAVGAAIGVGAMIIARRATSRRQARDTSPHSVQAQ